MSTRSTALRGRRVLVTGGTGFIGGRLAERLVDECGAEVHLLVRSVSRSVRAARDPVRFHRGDLLDRDSLLAATESCDVVFHCAYGAHGSRRERRRVTVEGTRHVCEAARQHRVSRLVHVSTVMVYGLTQAETLDETAPRKRSGEVYADSKLEAERLVFRAGERHGLPVTAIQPTAVYGPHGGVWTERIFRQLATGRVILVDGGGATCNAVYVDDLVSALLAAAVREEAVGEAYLVSGPEPVTWRRFYEGFESEMGLEGRTVAMSAAEARRHSRRAPFRRPGLAAELFDILREVEPVRDRVVATREATLARRLASRLPEALQRWIKARLGGGKDSPSDEREHQTLPVHPLDRRSISFFASRPEVRIDKARERLGYAPRFDLERGLELTGRWARWANLV